MINKKEYYKQWKKNNPEKVKESSKRYRENNRKKLSLKEKERREKNPEYLREYYRNNLEKWKVYNKNKQEYQKEWFKNNPDKIKIYNKFRIKKRSLDLNSKLNNNFSTKMRQSLKGNKAGRHWEDLIGYTLNILMKHLKKTMPKGYTWQDYLEGKLQIDHIIPIRIFNFTKPEHADFKKCWDLKNLRLLSAEQNYEKRGKIDKPFQPALKI